LRAGSDSIHIAADGGDWRNPAQGIEDSGIADVAGMENVLGAFKRGQRPGAEQPVSV
jgi:hypothetical protein